MNDLTGQTLGRYRIVEPIGRGGMASVYKAFQSSLDRYVAVKVLPPYYAHEPGFAMRFTREAKAVAKLDHPHILPIYDFGQEGDLSYIVMKYVAAGTLKDMLGQPMPLAQAVEIVCQIAAALDHAHEQGVIHRDVKPSNVLMDRGQWALLMDFGLAKIVAGSVQLTASGVGVGTPAYMAPEQGQGVAVDRRSDVYSLGIVLYEMLTGRVPFDAETPLAVVLKHITDPLPLPRTVNPTIPESIERVILKALSKEPDGRYATTGEMAVALQRAVAEGQVPAEVAAPLTEAVPKPPQVALPLEAPPVPERAEAPLKRKVPWWAFAGGAVALVALIGVILAAMGVFSGGKEPMPTSVPAPVPVTEGTLGAVLFEDDFEGQPSSRWQFLPQAWQIETSDGRTFVHNSPTAEGFSGAELRETSWSDYAIQFDFRFLKPDRFGGHYFYVRTRLTDCPPTVRALEGYVVLLSPDLVRLEKETCATQRRDTLAESDRDLALDEWHTLQLVVASNRIRVLVDGQEQIDFTDQEMPLLGGDVIVETENNVEFSLDNFYVYEVIPEEGGVVTAPTPTPLPIESIAPSPASDTRDIRPCAWDGLGPGLCVFAWEGLDPLLRLLEDTELEFTSAPSWSPDGQRIAFSAQEPGAESERPNDIYVANADGTALQALPSDRNDIVPAWSPDGEWLAFHSNCDLALMHPDGSDFTVIWPHEDGCTMVPQWSPDGEWIVFSLVPDEEWAFPMTREVWVISRDGDIITSVATVTHPSQECFQDTVAFSPDSARVAYFEADCQPMIVNADGTGQPAPLADFPYWWTATVYPQWGEGKPEPAGESVSPIEPSGRAIYVDANAPATGSNGSPAAPFNAIQTAIAVAGPGDTIKVATGTYDENLIIEDKTLSIEGGYDARTWEVTGWPADTVIDGGGRHRTVLIASGSRVVIEGFVVTHGNSPCRADVGVRGGSGGGGILVEDRGTEAAIQRSIIRDNIASDGCGGGGIEVAGGATVAVVNSVLTNNSANNGGGINVFGEYSRIRVVNSTIIGNSPDGASLGSDKRDILLNTIVWGNEDWDVDGDVEVSRSLVGIVSDEIEVKDSLVSIDPLLADPDVGDYHLQPGSPAVDAGALEGAPETDIDGDLRPMGAGVDIGADEVAGAEPTATPTPSAVPGGSGLFVDSGQALGDSTSNDVAVGDLDGDGDLDAFAVNGDEQPNEVWLNDGTGTFTDSGQRLGDSGSNAVALGDLDGDSDLDAFVGNDNADHTAWLNDGAGHFTDSRQSLAGSSGWAVALGDLDGDGDLDVFEGGGDVSKVWLNDGTGSFTDSGRDLVASDSVAVALGDLDDDGDLDAFVGNWFGGGVNQVWLNDGTGTFTDSGQNLGTLGTIAVALGDLDGDGDLDAFVANQGGEANRVWLNGGVGTFADSGQRLGNSDSWAVALGDLDGDGDLDAFVGNRSNQANKVWLNDGAGEFVDGGQDLGWSNSDGVALGDLDGDGDLDAFVGNHGPNRVWLNQGIGQTVALTAAPRVRDSRIESNIPYTPGESTLRYRLFVETWVDDPQGAGDIADVTLTYPDESVHSLLTEGDSYQPVAENNFSVGLWLDSPLTGEFVFTARDKAGHFTQEIVVVDEWLPMPDDVSPESDAAYRSGDALVLDFNFPFDPFTSVAQYFVYIQKGRDPGAGLEQVWQKIVSGPPVEYDGAPLLAGEYHWAVHVHSVKGNSFHLFIPFIVE